MTIHPARPKAQVGDEIRYEDRQGRLQEGRVRRVEAQWTQRDGMPSLTYTVDHPTARNGYLYIGGDDFR